MDTLKVRVFSLLLAIAVTGPGSHALNTVQPVVIRGKTEDSCPLMRELEAARNTIRSNIRANLDTESSSPSFNVTAKCGAGDWRRLYYLDMSDSSQSCPSGWKFSRCPVRGCTGEDRTCLSAYISTGDQGYSKVCGRLSAEGVGLPDGFHRHAGSSIGIERNYLDGVSITYGSPGSRSHVWSFAMGHTSRCPCGIPNPSFSSPSPPRAVGENYFCSELPTTSETTLWVGANCTSTDPCCSHNNPPYFSSALPSMTTEDLEMRICRDESGIDEKLYLTYIELYIQ